MKKGQKRYRPNVAAVILSSRYPETTDLFIAQRNDVKDAWQFPQGGIDEGETPVEALRRELKEEIGTDEVEILAEYPEWISYDFPEIVAKRMYPYDGQCQRYFLVRLKPGAVINLETEVPEFREFNFVASHQIFDYITYFKRPVYKRVLEYFKKEGFL